MIQRHITSLLRESLEHFPVVLLTGARQVGKSTLVEQIGKIDGRQYVTLDDRTALDAALADPDGFLSGIQGNITVDEVQRAPDLLRAIKKIVDRNRTPGRFLLTGSSNVVTLKSVSETLAGRVALHELSPFSFSEWIGHSPCQSLEALFTTNDAYELHRMIVQSRASAPDRVQEHILRGGYPVPALEESVSVRSNWFSSYKTTYVERDAREISAIERLSDFDRLLSVVAARTGSLANLANMGRDANITYTTLRRYVQILEQTYQIFFVPPFHRNFVKRTIKSPKLYSSDTGMASHLLGADSWEALDRQGHIGQMLETWVATELKKLISFAVQRMSIFGYRERFGHEVDFLLERGGEFVAIEVKAASSIQSRDTVGMDALRTHLRNSLRLEIFLYRGTDIVVLNQRRIAVPLAVFFS